MKEISVIIPAYNVEDYIEDCLQSLLPQMRKNWELICIDDCSQDNTYSILAGYAKRNENIRIIRNKENLGAAKSRNAGLKIAKGEYVIFLDSDDLFDLSFLGKMYDHAKRYDVDMTVCKYAILTCDALGQRKEEPVKWDEWKLLPTDLIDKEDSFPFLFFVIGFAPWNKLVKRKVLEENFILFQDLPNSNDICYSILSAACSNKIYFLNEHLIFYRENRENSLSSYRSEKKNYTIYAFEEIFKELERLGLYSGVIKVCLINFIIYLIFNFYNQYANELYKMLLMDIYERISGYLIEEDIRDIFYTDWCYYQYQCIQGKRARGESVYLIMRESILAFLEKKHEKYRIALWGAGKQGRKFIEMLGNKANDICSIIDNDRLKQGGDLNGIPIISYEESVGKTDVAILLNSRYKEEILRQIGTSYEVLDFWQYAQFGVVPTLGKGDEDEKKND